MGYELYREEFPHNGTKISVMWRGDTYFGECHSIMRSGDDCITIKLENGYAYGGKQVELLYEALGTIVSEYKDKKSKEERIYKQMAIEAALNNMTVKEWYFKTLKEEKK